jgi:hypothetical protein
MTTMMLDPRHVARIALDRATTGEKPLDRRASVPKTLPDRPIEGRNWSCVLCVAVFAFVTWLGLFAGVSNQAGVWWESVSQAESLSESPTEVGGLYL